MFAFLWMEEKEMALQGTVRVNVTENITLEQLNSIMGRIVGLTGCRTCGLIGIDLRLSAAPVEAQQLGSLPGVQSVTFE